MFARGLINSNYISLRAKVMPVDIPHEVHQSDRRHGDRMITKKCC